VAEKLRSSLEALHGAYETAYGLAAARPEMGIVTRETWVAFRYALTSYLALQNMLGLANEANLFDELAEHDHRGLPRLAGSYEAQSWPSSITC
jgi:hypothetical protein